MNLVELQNKIHQQNVDMGWWDEPRPFSTFVCLFHSELSEAMEGDRKGLMDDHLPHYPMFQVELADFVIRCLDFLGSTGNTNDFDIYKRIEDFDLDNTEFLAAMHYCVSYAFHEEQKPAPTGYINCLESIGCAVESCFTFAKLKEFDLHQIILEKVEYNKHRADHKRENRAKTGGKKY